MSQLPPPPLSREEIAQHARAIWEREGRPSDRDLEHWFRAEAELRLRRKHSDQTRAFISRSMGGAICR